MEPGKDSSELKLMKQVSVAGVVIAVIASIGKVPFTPDQVAQYLAGVMAEAGEWTKTLVPYVAGLAGFYAWLRTSLKKKDMGNGSEKG